MMKHNNLSQKHMIFLLQRRLRKNVGEILRSARMKCQCVVR